jgi:hypothetical protein
VYHESSSRTLEKKRLGGVGGACIYALREHTQAQSHPQLRRGLLLQSIARVGVAHLSFKAVLELLQATTERPLCVSFNTRATAATEIISPCSAQEEDDFYSADE